jgi:hypothetical protein
MLVYGQTIDRQPTPQDVLLSDLLALTTHPAHLLFECQHATINLVQFADEDKPELL